jgi:hypothetical protein
MAKITRQSTNALLFATGMGSTVTFRLSHGETKQLRQLLASADQPCKSVPDFFRYLLAYRYHMANGLPEPHPEHWHGAYRVGRPRTLAIPVAAGV